MTLSPLVLLAALLVAAGLCLGGRKATHAIRACRRRRLMDAELAAVPDRPARLPQDARGRARLVGLPQLPTDHAGHRDPTIGIDQVTAAERRARFLVSQADQGYYDRLRIEGSQGRS